VAIKLKLEDKLRALPDDPGVYLFKDAQGKVIYIGKARVLRNRVHQYFQNESDGRYQFESLVSHISDVEVITTDTELEALILENTLIRERQPRYNVDLRDDKSFPFLRVTNEPFPRIFLTRHPVSDGSRYFGPYSDLFHLKGLLRVLRGMLKIRTCNLPLTEESVAQGKFKVCLQFHIGRCNAPCVANESRDDYARRVHDFLDIVTGKGSEVVRRLREEQQKLADDLRFEQAAELRNWLSALDTLRERQKMISAEPINRDVFGLAIEDNFGCVVVFQVRNGRLLGRLDYQLQNVRGRALEDVLETSIERFYSAPVSFPESVLLPFAPPELSVLSEWLNRLAERKVEVLIPQRGDKAGLVELAQRNAELLLEERKLAREVRERIPAGLRELQKQLRLARLPKTIAAFDISTLQGTDKVASMVVFENGRAARSQYRHFKIRGVEGMDDFACMKEVVGRRFGRLKREAEIFPDLVLIDGGKGQLSAALDALQELNIAEQPIIGLAKRIEEVFVPGDTQPLNFPRTSSALKLLQQVRDEAHRFAIEHHRKLRGRRSLRSILDDIEGIGPARRKALLMYFGSVKALRIATQDEITAVAGMTKAAAVRVYEFFQHDDVSENHNADVSDGHS
jgi:excinuclease ABC subunit C